MEGMPGSAVSRAPSAARALCALTIAVAACEGVRDAGPAALDVHPSTVTLTLRQPRQLVPAVRSATGAVLSGRAVLWSSSNPEIAAIDANGLVTAVAPGEVTVSASLDSLQADVDVTVPIPGVMSNHPMWMTEMPQFPGPRPPQWTVRFLVPEGLVVAAQPEPIGGPFDRINEALRRAGVYDWATYAFGDSGFAVAARLEHIDEDGFPREARWAVPPGGDRAFTLQEYFRRLFLAEPGRYRVIVFIVTHRPLTADTSTRATEPEARRWLHSGAAALPDGLRDLVVPGARAHALIYEFYRPTEDEEPSLVVESQVQGPQHLIRAGLWPEATLLP